MATVKVTCPACKAGVQVGPDLMGKAIKCPKCKKPFKAPAAKASPSAPSPAAKPTAAPKPSAADAQKYVVSRAGKKFGPYTFAQLQQLVELGKLKPDDQLRKGADGDWEKATDVAGLFPDEEPDFDAEEESLIPKTKPAGKAPIEDEDDGLSFGDEDEAPAPKSKMKSAARQFEPEEDEEVGSIEEDEPAPRGKAKTSPRRPIDDDDDDGEEEDAPKAKKKKSGGGKLVLVLLLLLVLAGGGGAAWWFLLGPGSESGKIAGPIVKNDKKPGEVDAARKNPPGDGTKAADGPKTDDSKKTDDGKKDDAKKDDAKTDSPKNEPDPKKDGSKVDDPKKEPDPKGAPGDKGIELKYLSDQFQGIVVVNVQRLLRSPLAKEFDAVKFIRSKIPADEMDPTKIERIVFFADPTPAGELPATFGGIVRLVEPVDPKIFVEKKAEEIEFEGRKAWKVKDKAEIVIIAHDPKTYVLGVESAMKKMVAGGDRSPLRSKVAALDLDSADILAVGVFDAPNQPIDVRKMLEGFAKGAPEPFQGADAIVAKLNAATVALDLSGKNLLAATFDFADAEAAEALEKLANFGIGILKQAGPKIAQQASSKVSPDLQKAALAVVAELFDGIAATQKEKSVALVVRTPKGFADLIKQAAPEILKQIGESSQGVIQINNFRQIGLAMHAHHDVVKRFPAADEGVGPQGKDLSWRVALLPFLEQDGLFKQFKAEEPWDGPSNIKLLDKMPAVFANPQRPTKPGYTHVQAIVGPKALFRMRQGLDIVAITDGTSNTLLFVEGEEAVPWTKPADIAFDAKALSKLHKSTRGYLAAFADGSVRFLPKLDEKLLNALVTPAGNEKIELDGEAIAPAPKESGQTSSLGGRRRPIPSVSRLDLSASRTFAVRMRKGAWAD